MNVRNRLEGCVALRCVVVEGKKPTEAEVDERKTREMEKLDG